MKKRRKTETMNWMNNHNTQEMNMAARMAEDAGAPELRNPLTSGMRAKGFLSRLFGKRK
jgi:hypothetical protein